MIRARGLTKRYGGHAVLDGVDLELERGERVAILGLNGAGKTTLFRCLLGLVPFSGSLEVDGLEVRGRGREARRRIGYVPQRAPHFDGTLAETLRFFGELRGVPRGAVLERLGLLGLSLDEHGRKPVRALSGGMLQKALLALALAAEVRVLLLDEPTANLDPRARRELLKYLHAVEPATTILLASHRLGDVEAVAERVLVLHAGRFRFDGGVDALLAGVGEEAVLWLQVAEEERGRLERWLAEDPRVAGVATNGSGVGVRVHSRSAGVPLLAELHGAGFRIGDFWTEAPSTEEILERLPGFGGGRTDGFVFRPPSGGARPAAAEGGEHR